MKAWSYERVGAAADVLRLTELATPDPAAGEVRVRVQWSGVNPSDVKSRGGLRSRTLPFERIVPHSDGSGVIEAVGAGVDARRIGQRVWLWNAKPRPRWRGTPAPTMSSTTRPNRWPSGCVN